MVRLCQTLQVYVIHYEITRSHVRTMKMAENSRGIAIDLYYAQGIRSHKYNKYIIIIYNIAFIV